MSAYWFRLVVDGFPNGYQGLVVAQDRIGVFWGIDEFADPWQTEVKPAMAGGFCVCCIEEDGDWIEVEVSKNMPDAHASGWRSMKDFLGKEDPYGI